MIISTFMWHICTKAVSKKFTEVCRESRHTHLSKWPRYCSATARRLSVSVVFQSEYTLSAAQETTFLCPFGHGHEEPSKAVLRVPRLRGFLCVLPSSLTDTSETHYERRRSVGKTSSHHDPSRPLGRKVYGVTVRLHGARWLQPEPLLRYVELVD